MGLTLAQRQAVSVAIATRYKRSGKAVKGRMLDELCATTGWHRNRARKAQRLALALAAYLDNVQRSTSAVPPASSVTG